MASTRPALVSVSRSSSVIERSPHLAVSGPDITLPPQCAIGAVEQPKRAAHRERSMKLLSFVADGKELFGAVSGDGIVTMNDRVGQTSLRAALAAGAMAG